MENKQSFFSRVVKAVVDFIGSMKNRLVQYTTMVVFPFRSSWDAGYRPAFLRGNRPIDRKHVDELVALLRRKGKLKFTVAGTVTPLLPLLEALEELTEKYSFFDIFGNELTLNSPGVREGLYYLILDGQHRVAACYSYGFDMRFMLIAIEPEELFEYMGDYNSGQKNWNGSDWIMANRTTGIYTSPLFNAMDEVGVILPESSERYKAGILTGNQNGMKKADAVNGRETLVYDEPLVVRGIGFAKAIAVGLPVDGKVSKDRKTVGKWFRRLEGIRTILSVVPQCSGALISTFDVDMKNFLGHLDNQQVEIIAGLINKRSFGELDVYFLRQYKEYAEIHIEDRESVSAEIDALYAELAEQRRVADEEARQKAISTTSTNRPPRLQGGSIEDMRLNVEAMERYNKEKEERKSRKAERSEGVHS
jgi:hypothetical protein